MAISTSSLILVSCFFSLFSTQQEEKPQTGPIIDAIIKRIEEKTNDIWDQTSSIGNNIASLSFRVQSLTPRLEEIIKELREARLDRERLNLLEVINEWRAERQSFLESLREMREERKKLGEEISLFKNIRENFRQSIEEFRENNRKWREETQALLKEWTPLKNLIERFTNLIWTLIYALGAFALLIILVAIVVGLVYKKVKDIIPGI